MFSSLFRVPLINCQGGRECFYQFINARPTIRLRIITNQIIDRLTGKKHRLEQVADEHHKLREKLRDEKLSRDLADMEAEAELLQAMIDFEDLRHKKFTDYARSSTD